MKYTYFSSGISFPKNENLEPREGKSTNFEMAENINSYSGRLQFSDDGKVMFEMNFERSFRFSEIFSIFSNWQSFGLFVAFSKSFGTTICVK